MTTEWWQMRSRFVEPAGWKTAWHWTLFVPITIKPAICWRSAMYKDQWDPLALEPAQYFTDRTPTSSIVLSYHKMFPPILSNRQSKKTFVAEGFYKCKSQCCEVYQRLLSFSLNSTPWSHFACLSKLKPQCRTPQDHRQTSDLSSKVDNMTYASKTSMSFIGRFRMYLP